VEEEIFEEKRKTVPLEEESKKLRMELDASQKKIVAQLDRTHDTQQSPAAGQPSEQVRLRAVIKLAFLSLVHAGDSFRPL